MAIHVKEAKKIEACGNKPKIIMEYVGRVNTHTDGVSVAFMNSPRGWAEPGQTPEFDEYTLVLEGVLHVKTKNGEFDVAAGEAVIAHAGDWVRYSTPQEDCKYVAVCNPAFSPQTVHRDA